MKVSHQAADVRVIKEEVEGELLEAKPAMEKAKDALAVLDDNDINEVKSFPKPPPVVTMVLEVVLTYFKEPNTDWASAKKLMGDKNFKEKLKNYEVEKAGEKTLNKVRKMIDKKEFDPETIKSKAKAAACLARWCIALEEYARIRIKVKPLELKLAETTKIYDDAHLKLEVKLAEQKKAQDHVLQLEKDLNEDY